MNDIRMNKEAGIARLSIYALSKDGAIDDGFCLQVQKIVEDLKRDQGIKVLILSGTPEVFCYGATKDFLRELNAHYKNHVEHDYAHHLKALLDLPIPVIAAMEGSATGGGLVLGLYADIIVAAEESRYGMSFMNMGFTPGMGSTAMCREVFGYHGGFEMLVTGIYRKGSELKGKCGFNYILPRTEVMAKAMDLAAAIAEKPRTSLELLKKYMSIERRKMLEESSTTEAFMHRISFNQTEVETLIQEHFGGQP